MNESAMRVHFHNTAISLKHSFPFRSVGECSYSFVLHVTVIEKQGRYGEESQTMPDEGVRCGETGRQFGKLGQFGQSCQE